MFHGIRWRLGLTFLALMLLTTTLLVLALTVFRRVESVFLALAVAWSLSTWIGVHVATGMVRPLEEMTRVAGRLARGDLVPRVEERGRDEIAELARALNRMADQLHEYLGRLQSERQRLAAILQHMPSGVLLIDRRGRVALANPAAQQMLGVAAEALQGSAGRRSHLEVTRHYQLSELIDRVLHEGGILREQVNLLYPDERPVEVTASAVSSQAAGAEGVVVVLHDLSQAMRLDRARRDFFANVSHELRTPVTAIGGFAETLLEGTLEDAETARRFVEIIAAEAGRLQRLVDDLLELARLDAGPRAPITEPVDLVELARAETERFQARAGEAGIRLALEAPPAAVRVPAEREQVQRALSNLIDNALKYTPPGGTVTVRVGAEGDGAGSAELAVADTGCGIPGEELNRIFDRFYRGTQGRGQGGGTPSGTGLGLAIVKQIMERYGGRVEVESQPGRGSVFRLLWPPAASQRGE